MKNIYKFPEQKIPVVIGYDGELPIIDDEALAAEISRRTGVHISIVQMVIDEESNCLTEVGIYK